MRPRCGHCSPIPPRVQLRLVGGGEWGAGVGLMAQSDVHAPIRVPQLPSSCAGACLSTFLAAAHGHMYVPTNSTHGGVHSRDGPWRGPWVLRPAWPHQVSLTHASSHLCSPRSPATSPLCVSQVARQVSRGTQVTSQAHLRRQPGHLDGGGLWCLLGWAEPCPVPGSRC